MIPLVALLCLPAINSRTIAEARAAAGLEPDLSLASYIRSGASTPIRPRVVARTCLVLLTSHQRALERAWSSVRTPALAVETVECGGQVLGVAGQAVGALAGGREDQLLVRG